MCRITARVPIFRDSQTGQVLKRGQFDHVRGELGVELEERRALCEVADGGCTPRAALLWLEHQPASSSPSRARAPSSREDVENLWFSAAAQLFTTTMAPGSSGSVPMTGKQRDWQRPSYATARRSFAPIALRGARRRARARPHVLRPAPAPASRPSASRRGCSRAPHEDLRVHVVTRDASWRCARAFLGSCRLTQVNGAPHRHAQTSTRARSLHRHPRCRTHGERGEAGSGDGALERRPSKAVAPCASTTQHRVAAGSARHAGHARAVAASQHVRGGSGRQLRIGP